VLELPLEPRPAFSRTVPSTIAPQLPVLGLPAPEAEISAMPAVFRSARRFPLAAPEAPVALASKAKPAAPASPSAKQPAAASGASTAASPSSPVPAPSAVPLSATDSSAVAKQTTSRLREIYARPGDELQIGLEGTGFLFLGFPDKPTVPDGMSFKGKETRSGKTWFTFKAAKFGIYDLDFQQQDNVTGKKIMETVRVHVVSDQDFTAAIESTAETSSAASAAGAGDTAYAEKLASLGAMEAAVSELLKGYKEDDAKTNDLLAQLYLKNGDLEAAGKYYARNLAPANEFTDSAVLGMVRIAVAQKDQRALLSSLRQLLSSRDPGAEEILIQAARMETQLSEIGVGLELATQYANRYPDGRWRDEADFIAAQLLEADSRFRDIGRARDLYQGILRFSPESAFAGPARERLLYIERHFYQVR